jgi:regulator of protease activity HflC (stomatin/prohibitin superfamily)
MKKIIILTVLGLIVLITSIVVISSIKKVTQGYVGIKVNLLGDDKGVDNKVVGVGRYWIGMNQELYLYPTYQINYTYTRDLTEGSPANEEFTFQTKEGMDCSVDLGVAMHFDPALIPVMFQTYHKGEDDIRAIVVRNTMRDALNKICGTMPVESIYGGGKGKLIDSLQTVVFNTLKNTGIIIDKVYLIGTVRIPDPVKNALDAKVKMTQEAQAKENEVQKERAQADILVAKTRGVTESQVLTAKANAESILLEAKAQAEANKLINSSLSNTLIEYKKIEKWNGELPTVTGGSTPIIDLRK